MTSLRKYICTLDEDRFFLPDSEQNRLFPFPKVSEQCMQQIRRKHNKRISYTKRIKNKLYYSFFCQKSKVGVRNHQ